MSYTGEKSLGRRFAARALSEWGLIVVAMVLFSYAFYSISKAKLSPQETNLFAIVLTLASVLISWLTSRIYSRHSVDSTIRDNNVQVGNSVSSLKRQIGALSDWVSKKRSDAGGQGGEMVDGWLDHIEQTLLSMDQQIATTLQGIGSIIGDSDRQHGELISQIQTLVQEKRETERALDSALSPKLYSEYESKLTQLEERISEYTDKLGTFSAERLGQREEEVDSTCPYCRHVQGATIINRVGETRAISCKACGNGYNLHVAREGFFTRGSGYKSPAPESTPAIVRVLDLFSPPGFDYTVSEYEMLSQRVISLLNKAENENITPNGMIEALDSSGDLGMSKTKIRKFVQLLFWGRLFEFDGQPSYSTKILRPTTPLLIAQAFCRAIGQRMSNFVGLLEEPTLVKEVEAYFGGTRSPSELPALVEAYRVGHAHGIGGHHYDTVGKPARDA